MQLVVLVLTILVKVRFSVLSIQLQEGEGWERQGSGWCSPSPQQRLQPAAQPFPGLADCRDCDPSLKHFPLAKALRSLAPDNGHGDSSYCISSIFQGPILAPALPPDTAFGWMIFKPMSLPLSGQTQSSGGVSVPLHPHLSPSCGLLSGTQAQQLSAVVLG